MPSRFESTFRDRVIPAAERAFGVAVDFIFADDSELRLTAMVSIDDIPSGDENYVSVEGTITIRTELLTANLGEADVLTKARVRDEIYHVYAQSPSHAGLTVLNIRRKASEQKQTNMYDINDQQAVWHQA
jgi:hypothetical protein